MQKKYQLKTYRTYSIFAVSIVALALILTTAWQQPQTIQAATPDQFPTVGTVISNSNLRGGPGTSYDRTGNLVEGASVSLTGCNATCDWYQLSDGNWIAGFLISIGGAAPARSASSSAVPASSGRVAPLQALFRGIVLAGAYLYNDPSFEAAIVGTVSGNTVVNVSKLSNDNTFYQLDNHTWIESRLISEVSGSRSVTNRPTPPSHQVCDCSGDYYNCSNFANPGHAQMCLEYCTIQKQNDVHRLDIDRNGLACDESNNDAGFAVVAPSAASSSSRQAAPAAPVAPVAPAAPAAPAPTPIPAPIAIPTPVVLVVQPDTCSCSADMYDCANFATTDDAQACFWRCGALGAGDIHALDLDGNGMVCE